MTEKDKYSTISCICGILNKCLKSQTFRNGIEGWLPASGGGNNGRHAGQWVEAFSCNMNRFWDLMYSIVAKVYSAILYT